MYREGDEIDIWVVEAPLGQGGMGSVYRCHNRSARRILAAVKVLDGSLNRIPKIQARFIREAEILFALDHPNIVKVRNVRIDVDPPYLEMEFVDGKSLESRLEHGPIPLDEAVTVLRDMADALAYLHARNIRHRDVKPSNIVCTADGRCKLVDFGIATELDGATISEHGQAMGSASYVPPEWAQPGKLDPARWDLYGLGVSTWESLTGEVAFPMPTEGSASQRFLQTVAHKQGSAPLDPGVHFPVALRALVRDLTQPNPQRRVATAEVLLSRVRALDLRTVDPTHLFLDPPERAPSTTMVPGDEHVLEPARGHRSPPSAVGGRAHDAVAAPLLAVASRESPSTLGSSARRAEPTFDETSTVRPRGRPVEPPPAQPSAPPAKGRGPALIAAVALAGATLAGVVLAATWAWTHPDTPSPISATPEPRTVTFMVSGVTAGVPVALSLDGAPLVGVQGRWSAGPQPIGPHTLRSTVGGNCGAPAASWCREVSTPVDVKAGPGEQAEVVTLPSPEPRAVLLSGLSAAVRIAGTDAEQTPAGRQFPALLPGSYVATVADGRTLTVIVPWGVGPLTVPVEAPANVVAVPTRPVTDSTAPVLQPPPVAAVVKPVEPATTGETPGGTSAAHAVTNASFAAWLASHPEWTHDAAVAAGEADEGYLKGWTGADPPAGRGDRALVAVSWAAGQAYCKGRGGLASVDAEPLGWQESNTQPWHEYRQSGGGPAWRRSDGTVSATPPPRSAVNSVTGVRCAR